MPRITGFFSHMHTRDRGFTLIEVLISMTLISVILVIVFGGFRVGIRAWEAGEKNMDVQQHQQIVLELMRRQLASAAAETIETADDRELVFRGRPAALACISSYALMPDNRYGDVYVEYWLEDAGDTSVLKVYENNSLFESLGGDFRGASGRGRTYELMKVRNLRFSYLARNETGSYWADHWEAGQDSKIPAAIRCVLRKSPESPPVEMVVATKTSAVEENNAR